MIAWNPLPIEKLKKRVPNALLNLWDAEHIARNPDAPRPGEFPNQVFDFEDGVRLIISREKFRQGAIKIHVSLSIMTGGQTYKEIIDKISIAEVVDIIEVLTALAKNHIKSINLDGDLDIIGISQNYVIHWFLTRYQ